MNCLLIRHAHFSWVGHRLAGFIPDLHLSEEGLAQAHGLAERLSTVPLAAILCSPLTRTLETAAIIAKPHGLQPVPDDRWAEPDFGEWQGRTFDELASDPRWQQWNRERASASTPAGDTMQALVARALRAMRELPPGLVAIVTHGDVIRGLLLAAQRRSFNEIESIHIEPASVTEYARPE